jgi:hypothetical protein
MQSAEEVINLVVEAWGDGTLSSQFSNDYQSPKVLMTSYQMKFHSL